MAAVSFDATAFKVRYPEFIGVADELLDEYFIDAQMYLSNSDKPVKDEAKRLRLFWMLIAHIGQLAGALNEDGRPGPVGRVTSGSEGSVSASFEYNVPGTASWYSQTSYGANFWQATTSFRSFIYFARPTRY